MILITWFQQILWGTNQEVVANRTDVISLFKNALGTFVNANDDVEMNADESTDEMEIDQVTPIAPIAPVVPVVPKYTTKSPLKKYFNSNNGRFYCDKCSYFVMKGHKLKEHMKNKHSA